MKDNIQIFIIKFITLIGMLWIFPYIFELKNIELSNVINMILNIMPFILGGGLLIMILMSWIESTDELPSFDINRLKFWEWEIKRFFIFIFIAMWIGSILNKSMGFVFSICLFWISLYKIIREYDIWMKKEAEENG